MGQDATPSPGTCLAEMDLVNLPSRIPIAVFMTRFAPGGTERQMVMQTCDLYANIFGLPGAVLGGVPVRIGSRRELNPDKSGWQIQLQRLAYRFATKVVANSPAARQMLESEGLSPASIAVIPNGLDLAAFAECGPRTDIRTT